MPIDFTDIHDIARFQSGIDYVPSAPPFSNSTVQYRQLKDRSRLHPDLVEVSPEELAELESGIGSALYTLDGYHGFAMVLEILAPEAELEAKHILEPVNEWSRSIYMADPAPQRMMPPPMPPPCLLLRRPEPSRETYLSLDAVLYLRSVGVRLVGVESPAIANDDTVTVIEPLMQEGDLTWLVKLDLRNVQCNRPYYLCAFPIGALRTGPMPCRPVLIAMNA